nr:lymphocyte-specific protein 1-like [Symphalangus syndactylus]
MPRGLGRWPRGASFPGQRPPPHPRRAAPLSVPRTELSCEIAHCSWSVEDEEEAVREQCQRERDRQLPAQDGDGGGLVPERPEQEMLPSLHACEKEDSDEVHLEELSLSKEGPGPEDTVQDNLEASGAEEEQEEHQKYQQPRTPSPLVLEGTIEQSSPHLSPPIKLIDRTEFLNCSIEKRNSVKKSQPDLPISKIDHWLEQYTQAIETAGRTPKLAHQASIELPSMAVASTKSQWETGEVQAQSAAKTPSCKITSLRTSETLSTLTSMSRSTLNHLLSSFSCPASCTAVSAASS